MAVWKWAWSSFSAHFSANSWKPFWECYSVFSSYFWLFDIQLPISSCWDKLQSWSIIFQEFTMHQYSSSASVSRGLSAQYTAFSVNNMMIKCRITRLSDVRRIQCNIRRIRVSGVILNWQIGRIFFSGVNIRSSRSLGYADSAVNIKTLCHPDERKEILILISMDASGGQGYTQILKWEDTRVRGHCSS